MELPEQLREAVQLGPVDLVDPATNQHYVVIRAEAYERIAELLDQQDVRAMYPNIAKVFGPEGWDDPAMDIYNDLDPRK